MTRKYMVVYERVAEDNWGAWTPDIGGAVGAGDTIEQVRESLREGILIMLEDALERNQPMPEALATSVDFSEFDADPSSSQYVIEWMTVELPTSKQHSDELLKQAA